MRASARAFFLVLAKQANDIRLGRRLGTITYQNILPITPENPLLTACLPVANTLGFSKREEHKNTSSRVFFTEI